MRLVIKTINSITKSHSGTVIFFHGAGDTGINMNYFINHLMEKELKSLYIKYVFPTAPLQRFSLHNGEKSYIWFDRKTVSIQEKEDANSLARIYQTIEKLIQNELNEGISLNQIIVGGFSMGGALALHTAYHLKPTLGGVFVCSSYLNRTSIVFESLTKFNKIQLPELIMFHGNNDEVVPKSWAEETFHKLTDLGVHGEFISFDNQIHELKKKELIILEEWLHKKIST